VLPHGLDLLAAGPWPPGGCCLPTPLAGSPFFCARARSGTFGGRPQAATNNSTWEHLQDVRTQAPSSVGFSNRSSGCILTPLHHHCLCLSDVLDLFVVVQTSFVEQQLCINGKYNYLTVLRLFFLVFCCGTYIMTVGEQLFLC